MTYHYQLYYLFKLAYWILYFKFVSLKELSYSLIDFSLNILRFRRIISYFHLIFNLVIILTIFSHMSNPLIIILNLYKKCNHHKKVFILNQFIYSNL